MTKKTKIILAVVLAVAWLFYWYEMKPDEIRPADIRSACNLEALLATKGASTDKERIYDFMYKVCLHRSGL